jgi:pimeloyl-ACP methyl ester carboxylesterase
MRLDHHRGGSGEPLVLIHGIGHTWRGFKPMFAMLEPHFDVLAVDLPGFGRSAPLPPGTEPTPEALADAVERELEAAGFGDRVHVAGNSLGGWVALELGRRGRAHTVTAISPAGLQHGRERAWGRGLLLGMRWLARNAPAPEPLLRTALGRTLLAGPAMARPWRADPDDVIEQARMFGSAPGFLPTLSHTSDRQPRGLDEIPCPVLVLWGTRDLILLPRQGRRFERLIPGAQLRYLRGLGHTPMSDDPRRLSEAILAFHAEWERRAARAPTGPGTDEPAVPAPMSRQPRR